MSKEQNKKTIALVTVGSLTQRKGQLNVIRALPVLRERLGEVIYHVVGIPLIKDRALSEADRLGVRKHVIIHGALSFNQMIEVLRQSDIVIMLSEHTPDGSVEGFGIAVVEANAMGLPAIGSVGTGLEDAIHHGYSGMVVNPHDPDAVCKAVETICNNYHEFSAQAIQHARKFTWESVGSKYVEEIKSLTHVERIK